MDTKLIATTILLMLAGSTAASTQTHIDDPITEKLGDDSPLADDKPSIAKIHPPDGASNMSVNPEISFRVKDVDTDKLDVIVVKGREVIYNQEVEAGNFVTIDRSNTTLGDSHNKDYEWKIEVSDETNTVTKKLSFNTLNPFQESPDHSLGNASVLLDYENSNTAKYSGSCPNVWNTNDTTCIYSAGNPRKIQYDNGLYLMESNNFSIRWKATSNYVKQTGYHEYSGFGGWTKLTFFDKEGHSVSFSKNLDDDYGAKGYWKYTFVQQDDGRYAITWKGNGGTQLKTVNFTKHEPVYWKMRNNRVNEGYNRHKELRIYEWNTDMATLKEDVNKNFLSIFSSMSIF